MSIEKVTIDHACGTLALGTFFGIGALHNRDDRQFEVLGETPVTFIATWNAHNGPHAVSGQHIIGNPDGDACAVQGIDGVATRGNTADCFHFCHTLPLGA